MQNVSTSELKNQLSKYLQKIRSGRSFLVTDRGNPVAALVPLDQVAKADSESRRRILAAQGTIRLPQKKLKARPVPSLKVANNAASAFITEDRR